MQKKRQENFPKIYLKSRETEIKRTKLTLNVWLGAILQFFKYLVVLVGVISLFIGLMFFVSPETDAKIFDFLGLSKAEEQCYVQIYKNSGQTSDLYNLVIFEMNEENYAKEKQYIEELLAKDDYADFISKLDASAVVSAGENKLLYVYVANTDAYLRSRLVKCEFYLELESSDFDVETLVELCVSSLESDNFTDNSFATFMSLLYSSDLSENEKSSAVLAISNALSSGSLSDAIEEKISAIETQYENSESELEKILLKYSEAQLLSGAYYSELNYYGISTTKSTEYSTRYKTAFQEYNSLCE